LLLKNKLQIDQPNNILTIFKGF